MAIFDGMYPAISTFIPEKIPEGQIISDWTYLHSHDDHSIPTIQLSSYRVSNTLDWTGTALTRQLIIQLHSKVYAIHIYIYIHWIYHIFFLSKKHMYVYIYIIYIWSGLEHEFYLPIQLGISKSQLTCIFQRGRNHQRKFQESQFFSIGKSMVFCRCSLKPFHGNH